MVEVRPAHRAAPSSTSPSTAANRRKPAGDTLRQLQLTNPYVVSSPRKRAQVTAELAGLTVDEVTPLISEWDYGDYEGTTTEEIRKAVPDWLVWTHGCPGGETVRSRSANAPTGPSHWRWTHMESRDVVFVGHGHFSRAVITRWVEQPVYEGIRFAMACGVRSRCAASNTGCASSARSD